MPTEACSSSADNVKSITEAANKGRLLFVFDNLEVSGVHQVAIRLMSSLEQVGWRCDGIISMTDKLTISDRDARFIWPGRCIGSSEALLAKTGKILYGTSWALRHAKQYDIIIATCPVSALVAGLAGLFSARPVIGWIHYDCEGRRRLPLGSQTSVVRDWLQNRLYFEFMPLWHNLAFVSQSTLESMQAMARISSRPVNWIVLPNLYANRSFSAESTTVDKFEAVKAIGDPVFLFLGRISWEKGWNEALQVANEVNQMGIAAQWIFIGDGPDRNAFCDAVKRLSISSRIHWLGSDPNPIPALQKSDALILTSKYEAWPTVILEAFAEEIPVVSYDCRSGPAEMLGGNLRGWLTTESPKAMADAIALLLTKEGQAEAVRRKRRARRYIEQLQSSGPTATWSEYMERIMASRPKA